jgi:hypothetical protein
VQVVGIEPDQLRPNGHRPATGLGPRAVGVFRRDNADLALGGGDVLVPEPKGFADPAATVIKQGEEEAVSQPGAGVQDRLCLGGSQDRGSFLGVFSAIEPRSAWMASCPALICCLAQVWSISLSARAADSAVATI